MRNPQDLETGSKRAPGDLAFVQGFINTVDVESGKDAFSTSAGLADWLRHHGLLATETGVGEKEWEQATGFREGLRSLVLHNNGEEIDRQALVTLENVAMTTPLRFHYGEAGDLGLEPHADDMAGALARLQAIIYEAMLRGTWVRLKACLCDTCRWAFYDASKNRSGSWCSMEVCGNRTKVRKHRQRNTE
ncbi:MAG: CGNR zinc finger domain-containing protein [Trueperaceae bacterium]